MSALHDVAGTDTSLRTSLHGLVPRCAELQFIDA